MENDTQLQQVQRLQLTDRPKANALLLAFVREIFKELDIATLDLTPKKTSLNSINGFLTLNNGHRYFFKTHTEPKSIVKEYYNVPILQQAGYTILPPTHASTDYGKQFLLYEDIGEPEVFQVTYDIEHGTRNDDIDTLTSAQQHSDDALFQIYSQTLEFQSSEEAEKAAIHSLFHHRLAGERYQDFYSGKVIALPGKSLLWETICKRHWIINGIQFQGTLEELIQQAKALLHPDQAGPSIIGHGDAHNGNLFYTPPELTYFDPAVAGRHHPLLDIIKPLFHNVFATWLYDPDEINAKCHITWTDDGQTIIVNHDYQLSDSRKMFFESKVARVLTPTLHLLKEQNLLPSHWRRFMKSALMCCPLLTKNIANSQEFPQNITLLALSFVVEMGMPSRDDSSYLDNALKRAQEAVT